MYTFWRQNVIKMKLRGERVPSKKAAKKTAGKKKEVTEMIRLGRDIYAVLAADAAKSQRSATKQLRFILLKHYGIEAAGTFDPEEVIRQLQSGQELKENGTDNSIPKAS